MESARDDGGERSSAVADDRRRACAGPAAAQLVRKRGDVRVVSDETTRAVRSGETEHVRSSRIASRGVRFVCKLERDALPRHRDVRAGDLAPTESVRIVF